MWCCFIDSPSTTTTTTSLLLLHTHTTETILTNAVAAFFLLTLPPKLATQPSYSKLNLQARYVCTTDWVKYSRLQNVPSSACCSNVCMQFGILESSIDDAAANQQPAFLYAHWDEMTEYVQKVFDTLLNSFNCHAGPYVFIKMVFFYVKKDNPHRNQFDLMISTRKGEKVH